jgi:hypothetical protein
MKRASTTRSRPFHIGFQASVITVFVAMVLIVGLTLVYLSFARVTSITRAAASSFIEKAAQLSADHVDEKFKTVRDFQGLIGVRLTCRGRRFARCSWTIGVGAPDLIERCARLAAAIEI